MHDENLTRADTAAGFEDNALGLIEIAQQRQADALQAAQVYATLALGQRVAELTERLDALGGAVVDQFERMD